MKIKLKHLQDSFIINVLMWMCPGVAVLFAVHFLAVAHQGVKIPIHGLQPFSLVEGISR